MKNERWHQVEQICEAALDKDPAERAAFLKEACGEDEAMRREVEALLTYEEPAKGFIETPAMEVAAKAIAEKRGTLVGRQVGHYRILSLLGAGGMGEVYLAQDNKLGRTVAIKFLPHEVASSSDRLSRFVREAKAASALNHPNVATIHEIGEAEDNNFIVMEYVEGKTLSDKINERPLDVPDILDIAIQVADALEDAHSKDIIHRDIKSANLMLTPRRQVKVLDFGVAKVRQPEGPYPTDLSSAPETRSSVLLGTVQYMSPEQVLGRDVDLRTDLFSLGVVIYEMATGKIPFAGNNVIETIDKILHAQPESITRPDRNIPPELQRIVTRCLAKNREQRYHSAGELLADLRGLKRTIDSGTQHLRLPSIQALSLRSVVLAGALLVLVALGLYRMGVLKSSDSMQRDRKEHQTQGSVSSIAVLPFQNLSPDPENQFFSEGLTEELINALTKVGLRVPSRTSVFQLTAKGYDIRKIGDDLGVNTVVEGSVRKEGNKVRVTARISKVAEGYLLWSETYERELKYVFEIQEQIALAIVKALEIQLAGDQRSRLTKRPTENAEAYQLYLRGRLFWNKYSPEGWKKALDYFRRASEIDPNYSLAYAGMADCYAVLSGIALHPRDGMPKAKAAARKALEIDDHLAEAHTSLAFVNLRYEYDWTAAEEGFQRAIQLDPSYATAHRWYFFYLAAMGRFEEGIEEMKRAQELEPLSLIIGSNLGAAYLFARKYDQAIEEIEKTLEIDPTFYRGLGWLGLAYQQKGMHEQSIACFQKYRQLDSSARGLAQLGQAYAAAGKRAEAGKVLEELRRLSPKRVVPPYHVAAIHAALGDSDRAFEWLEKAYEERSEYLIWIKVHPMMESLRSDPRFQDLLKKMNLAS